MEMQDIETLGQVAFVLGAAKLLDKVLEKLVNRAVDEALKCFSKESKESRKKQEEKDESHGNGG